MTEVNTTEVIVKKKKKRKTGINTKSKKKTAVARAVIKKGTGKIKVNKKLLETIDPKVVRKFISEPLVLAGDLAKEVDISVNTNGGGFMGQAVATRSAIAKALIRIRKNDKLKEKFLNYDRLLLVDDPRKKEAKKPLGPSARAKKQKSKR
jgi:small subunit ribosomal protein S9